MDPVRHAHVTDADFHGPLAVLVFQKNRNALPVSVLDGVADPLEKVVPLRRVIGLERVVVPVDSRPNDEVGIELGSKGRARAEPLPGPLVSALQPVSSPSIS